MLRRQAGNDQGYESRSHGHGHQQARLNALGHLRLVAVECLSTLSRLSSLHFSSPLRQGRRARPAEGVPHQRLLLRRLQGHHVRLLILIFLRLDTDFARMLDVGLYSVV